MSAPRVVEAPTIRDALDLLDAYVEDLYKEHGYDPEWAIAFQDEIIVVLDALRAIHVRLVAASMSIQEEE